MPETPADPGLVAAGLGRRAMALLYESLLAFAVAFFAGWVFFAAAGGIGPGLVRHIFQAYLFLVLGGYFVLCWRRGGGTLAMHTWRLRLVRRDGTRIGLAQAWMRYALAWASLLPLGAGFLWALVDRDRQFLHDRLAGTRVVLDARPAARR
jgi:uncharacterized RDD family membrane protein YckC